MKWSTFTFHVKSKDNFIVYNTLNKGVVKLNKEKYDLKSLKDKKTINYLKKNEYIFDDDYDEKNNYINSFMKEWNNSDFLGLHILTTTGCNFKCPYCYQSGIDSDILTKEKSELVLNFINEYIINNKIKETNIEITGGEPTINWDVVTYFLPKLIKIFKQNKVTYKLSIVTNGYLLSKDKVDLLSKYNWKRLQITVDGLEDIHNKRRILKNNNGSFNEIIQNLDYIVNYDKIKKINLRINYDKSNINKVTDLLEFIKKKYGVDKIIISLGLITKTVNHTDANIFIEKNGITEDDFVKKYLYLYKKAYTLGFKMQDFFSFDGFCTSKMKHGFVIEPNGNIVKCVSGVGRDDFIIGNVYKKKFLKTNYLYEDLYLECLNKKCSFLPVCHTGCRFESLVKNNNMKKQVCKKDLLEKVNSKILKINYD